MRFLKISDAVYSQATTLFLGMPVSILYFLLEVYSFH